MVFITNIKCSVCGDEWTGPDNQYGPNICLYCVQKSLNESKEKYFDELKLLTLEERIDRIEKWIYDYCENQLNNGIKYY